MSHFKTLIKKYEAGNFTKWKRFRGVAFNKAKPESSNVKSIYDLGEYKVEKLMNFGAKVISNLKTKGKLNQRFKCYYFSGIGVCIKLKTASMICYRGAQAGDPVEERTKFTKSCDCKAVLKIGF